MKEVWTRGHTIGDLQILQIHRFFQGHFSSHIGNLSGCLLSHQMQQVSLIWKHRPCNRKPDPMTYDIRIGNLLGNRGQILLGPRMLQSTDTQPGLFKQLYFFSNKRMHNLFPECNCETGCHAGMQRKTIPICLGVIMSSGSFLALACPRNIYVNRDMFKSYCHNS